MKALEDNKDILLLGAKLELIGDREAAGDVYRAYVREAARLSEYEDSLEIIYGHGVYDREIPNYGAALDYATVAVAARRLIELMRSKFPTSLVWADPERDGPENNGAIEFFRWLGERRTVDICHVEILKNAKRTFEAAAKICVDTSPAVSRGTLMNAVTDLVCGSIKVSGRKLR